MTRAKFCRRLQSATGPARLLLGQNGAPKIVAGRVPIREFRPSAGRIGSPIALRVANRPQSAGAHSQPLGRPVVGSIFATSSLSPGGIFMRPRTLPPPARALRRQNHAGMVPDLEN